MATEHLKTTVITNLNTLPPTRATTGAGAAGVLRHNAGTITGTTAMEAAGTYRFVRVPWTVKVKHVRMALNAAVTNLAGDIGVYYSDSAYDGTPVDLQGDAVDVDLFGADIDLESVVALTDYTNESTNYTAAKRAQPLWQAAGLTACPAGYADIALTLTETTDGAPVMYMEVEYVE
ncbi:MAG: hypothetical protein AB7H90_03520 [Alphaproteobacteria bacterium]